MADKYRFAFDLGTNSIGWAVYLLNQAKMPADLVDAGVRIFSDGRDPKSGASLAEERRGPRAMRRRRDRYLQRRTFLMDELIKAGLMPTEEAERKALEKLDPYVLRRRGLDEPLSLHEFGRVIFHLNQRRGFQSNRIADAGNDDESGKIKTAAKKLLAALKEQDCRTYGEFLAKRQAAPKVREREAVRIRLIGAGAKALYDFYPTRDILKHEFDALWDAQLAFHPFLLTVELRGKLHDTMFFQRPLKDPIVGKCTFFPEEPRLAKSHPLSQARRIYQDLNHLRLKEGEAPARNLTLGERDKLAFVLLSGEEITLKAGIRKILKYLPANTTTSLEEGGKTDRLIGDQLVARFGKKGPLKNIWGNFNLAQRADIAWKIGTEQSEPTLVAYLRTTYGVSEEAAQATANIKLPDGHDHLGLTATARILEALKAEVIPYNVAVDRGLELHHSDERDGVIHDRLPFYGEILERHTLGGSGDPNDTDEKRYGRLANPTVHVGLNQLRRVVNALIRLYDNPEQIVVELARDLKMSRKQKDELAKQQKGFEEKNKECKALLESDASAGGADYNPGNLRLMRLWEELGPMPRRCVYSGNIIGIENLFNADVEVEHILPYSRTLDDTMANKTLSFRMHNRLKRNMSPAEAFSDTEYEEIRRRAQILPPNKRWRFEKDAMEKYKKEGGGFAARQLNDTKHLAVLARKYLVSVCNSENGVRVVTGQMTALLRQRFGLNGILSDDNHKNRTDHRHHAVDACVIGIIDPWILNEIASNAADFENKNELSKITTRFPEPFRGKPRGDFRERVKAKIDAIIVSHKPEHGSHSNAKDKSTSGQLHEDSSYGINNSSDREDGNLVKRKALDSLTTKEIDKIRDGYIRSQLQEKRDRLLERGLGKKEFEKELSKILVKFGEDHKVRRVRILIREREFISIKDRKTRRPYRAVIGGENHHIDVVEDTDGVCKGFATTVFEFNQKDRSAEWKTEYPDAKFIMRLHKGDLVQIKDDDGITKVKRVVRLEIKDKRIRIADHNESGVLQKRHEDPDDSFRWDAPPFASFKERDCKLYNVDELGKPRK